MRNEAVLLTLLVLFVALALFAVCGVEIHHVVHHVDQGFSR